VADVPREQDGNNKVILLLEYAHYANVSHALDDICQNVPYTKEHTAVSHNAMRLTFYFQT